MRPSGEGRSGVAERWTEAVLAARGRYAAPAPSAPERLAPGGGEERTRREEQSSQPDDERERRESPGGALLFARRSLSPGLWAFRRRQRACRSERARGRAKSRSHPRARRAARPPQRGRCLPRRTSDGRYGGGGGGDEPPYFFSDFILNDAFTFDSFVVGDCNELAHASAKAITEFPGRGYNPFFLYGGSGLGKTHLLQAICHSVRRRHGRKRIVYLSCESFVNQFIQAITDGEVDSFRQRCRQVDLLVIDDIQFLEGKTRTQDEFFHTFNSLFHGDKQIVLSSDRPPKEIPTLQDRLISRFRWGMVTEVERPRFETRVAIVQRKAEMRGVLIAPEVSECIAENIDSNIRELEGAVTKVMNYAELMHRRIDLDAVKDALRDLVPDTPQGLGAGHTGLCR